MILIISSDNDHSTYEVCLWLRYYNKKYIRINGSDKCNLEYADLKSDIFKIILNDEINIDVNSISSIWYRRGLVNLFNPNIYKVKEFVNFDNNLYRDIVNHIIEEKKVAHDYIQYHFENIPHIGTYSQREVNKLIVLTEALRLGINIPATFLACNKKVLVESESINAQNMITKSISEAFSPVINNTPYVTYTESVNALTLPNKFELSLFQEKIEKEADIRVFYILGDFYSMSIMSQNNNQTETDFRKYDKETPNRKFSFSLPKALTLKLDQLMKKLKLETGSIDLVFTKSGDFIFLEVNPVGQFGMTSYPCNYFLEKIIGKKLTQIQLKA